MNGSLYVLTTPMFLLCHEISHDVINYLELKQTDSEALWNTAAHLMYPKFGLF